MSDYLCPQCSGGFPSDALDDNSCPWCGEQLGTVEKTPTVKRIVRTQRIDEDDILSASRRDKLHDPSYWGRQIR